VAEIEQQVDGALPTVCILSGDASKAEVSLDKPWLRSIGAPVDCFQLLVLIQDLKGSMQPVAELAQ
jgi:hypothetical protein